MNLLNTAQEKFFKLGLAVSLFVLLGKLVSFARELCLSYFYGSNVFVEGFFFNFNIINLIAGIYLNTIIFYLIPQIKTQHSFSSIDYENKQILSFTYLGIISSIILVFIFYLGFNFELFKISENLVNNTEKTYLIFCISFPFLVLTFVFTSILTSKNIHVGLFYESFPSFLIIIGIIFISQNDYLLAVSFFIGVLFQLVALNFHRNLPVNYIKKNMLSMKEFSLNKFFFIVLVAQIIFALPNFIDHFIVSTLEQGSLAHFTYANKIYSIVYSIIFLIVSRTLITFFVENQNVINAKFILYLFAAFLSGTIFCTLLYLSSNLITKLLFYRGEFNSFDLQKVSELFQYFTFLIPFYLIIVISITFFYGKKKIKIIFIICFSLLFPKIIYILSLEKITIIDIPLSTLCGFISSSVCILIIMIKESENNLNTTKIKKKRN